MYQAAPTRAPGTVVRVPNLAESGEPPRRQLVQSDYRMLLRSPGYRELVARRSAKAVGDAELVSSRVAGRLERHLPCLDIDHPATLAVRDGRYELYVEVPCRRWRYRRALRALQRAGLSPQFRPARAALRRAGRAGRYAGARDTCVDSAAFEEVLRGLGPDSSLSFEELHQAAAEIAPLERGLGPPLLSPWCFPLEGEALLVESSNHHHLYLEPELSWETYAEVLKALAASSVLEWDWVKLAMREEESRLRLPWRQKAGEFNIYGRRRSLLREPG